MKQSYIYLAGPYSHESIAVRTRRYRALTKKAGELIKDNRVVYSPITHGHWIAAMCPGMPLGFLFWEKQALEMLSHASKLMVLCLDGWEESKGVTAEIDHATKLRIPVEFIELC